MNTITLTIVQWGTYAFITAVIAGLVVQLIREDRAARAKVLREANVEALRYQNSRRERIAWGEEYLP